MLKNELDEKVRKYRQKQYGNVSQEERIEQEKRNKAEVEEAANYAAKCIWEKLRKKFISHCKTDQPIIIFMGITNRPGYDNGTVYYRFWEDYQYKKLFYLRMTNYANETMEAICKIAKKEGILCDYQQRASSYLECANAICYKFTYYPPQ